LQQEINDTMKQCLALFTTVHRFEYRIQCPPPLNLLFVWELVNKVFLVSQWGCIRALKGNALYMLTKWRCEHSLNCLAIKEHPHLWGALIHCQLLSATLHPKTGMPEWSLKCSICAQPDFYHNRNTYWVTIHLLPLKVCNFFPKLYTFCSLRAMKLPLSKRLWVC